MKAALAAAALALALGGAAVAYVYLGAMERAYARIQGHSEIFAAPAGDIEYTLGGEGPDVLVVHGSGGGFDQGAFLARAALGERFRWIAPSRFGYLRSTFRPGATFEDQAQAFAQLLDHLGVQRVAVVAFSHGGPSALLFALRHPERVSSLTLLSAGVAASGAPDQQQANDRGDALTKIFQQDIRYWAVTQLFRRRFLELMGASDAVIAALDPAQTKLAEDLIDLMNPVAPRAAGVRFDNGAAMPDARIAGIRAPTLILHARDDTLQLFHNAEFAARHIAGARLVAFDRGGHLLLAVEQPAVRRLVAEHIAARAGPAASAPR